jgi:hypothetical protein
VSIPGLRRNLLVLKSRHFKAKKDNSLVVDQLKLEMFLGMRRELAEMEESIAVALSKGARVEPGVHKAELVPERRSGDGSGAGLVMKLVILLFLLVVAPAVISLRPLVEDVNGDGKIDIVDLELEMAGAAASPSAEKGVLQNA